jgi:hypothetical protein
LLLRASKAWCSADFVLWRHFNYSDFCWVRTLCGILRSLPHDCYSYKHNRDGFGPAGRLCLPYLTRLAACLLTCDDPRRAAQRLLPRACCAHPFHAGYRMRHRSTTGDVPLRLLYQRCVRISWRAVSGAMLHIRGAYALSGAYLLPAPAFRLQCTVLVLCSRPWSLYTCSWLYLYHPGRVVSGFLRVLLSLTFRRAEQDVE